MALPFSLSMGDAGSGKMEEIYNGEVCCCQICFRLSLSLSFTFPPCSGACLNPPPLEAPEPSPEEEEREEERS